MVARRPASIIDLAEFDEPKNILVYGDPGCGKTPFGASAPNSLIIATEPGTVSARRLGYGRNVKVWGCVDDWNEVVKAFRWLKDNPDHGFEWVVVDNATQMQEVMLRELVGIARRQNSNRDEDIPAIQDYQKWYLMFDRFVKSFNALPVSVLWLAHTMRKQNEDGEDLILPSIQGQDYAQATKFCGRMQAIGYMEQRTVKQGNDVVFERRIQWRKTQTIFAKDRYIFRKDVGERYTICARGEVEKTGMVEISRRIDAALTEKRNTPAKAATGSRPAAHKATKRTATRRATTGR